MMNKVIIVCTGGRDYNNANAVSRVLSNAKKIYGDQLTVFVGDAPGLDKMVFDYCGENDIYTAQFFANWKQHKNAAGPIRNIGMVNSALNESDKVIGISFPGGNGTKHCTEYMLSKGIKVHIVKE